jgi:hypothetical protein
VPAQVASQRSRIVVRVTLVPAKAACQRSRIVVRVTLVPVNPQFKGRVLLSGSRW